MSTEAVQSAVVDNKDSVDLPVSLIVVEYSARRAQYIKYTEFEVVIIGRLAYLQQQQFKD